jgi:hypothetical protein
MHLILRLWLGYLGKAADLFLEVSKVSMNDLKCPVATCSMLGRPLL